MNREIKFRAFDKETKTMTDWEMMDERRNFHKLLSLSHVDVMQYTGLKDRNGKEIYEGDILTDKDKNITIVVWIDEWAMFGCMFHDEWELYRLKGVKEIDESMFWTFPIENNQLQVIGNIHENNITKTI